MILLLSIATTGARGDTLYDSQWKHTLNTGEEAGMKFTFWGRRGQAGHLGMHHSEMSSRSSEFRGLKECHRAGS